MSEIEVLHSLHRPYHCPLWIVKWVCFFYAKRSSATNGCFLFEDLMVDMYFKMLVWLRKYYPTGCVGIPSMDAIKSVLDYFEHMPLEHRVSNLKDILTKPKRERGVEKQVYSTYKAVSYYDNLAKDKLCFVDKNGKSYFWSCNTLKKFKFSDNISKSDRKIYLRQLLKYDGHFFLSQCFLYKYIRKYDLKAEEVVFEFMQKFYPTSRFDFVSKSYLNYYVVRKHWIELLGIVSSTGIISASLRNCIRESEQLVALESDILNNIKIYVDDIRRKHVFLKNIGLFYTSYRKRLKEQADIRGFVNLYDVCSEMKMSYTKFNAFLGNFYESERLKRNIFFINIVSTIDQRKRFYVRETPVLKIKIS